ncbi:HTH domain-containing protein, partial [bacterium]|nr:HTH domain-containing protein [bacterium]
MNRESSTQSPTPCTAPVILVYANGKIAYSSIRKALGRNYACLHADCRQAVYELLRDNPIDMPILDHEGPAAESLCFLRHVKSAFPQLPVIYLVSKPSFELSRDILSYKGGAKFLLRKPDELNQLGQHVSFLLQNREGYHSPNRDSTVKKPNKSLNGKESKLKREQRLWEIVESLRKKPKHYTSGVLARKFQVSDRQIRMDIQLLIDRGCPIQKEKKCYF